MTLTEDQAGRIIWYTIGHGDTIAEAADKCREALELNPVAVRPPDANRSPALVDDALVHRCRSRLA